MRRVFISALVIGAFIFSTLPVGARSRRCPVKMPETLLSLYKKSDAIFIARFDRKEDVNIASEGDGYSVVNVRSHFDVSSSLKGETQKLFVLEDEEYRYKTEPQDENVPAEQAVFIEGYGDENGHGKPAAGDTVLLFLKKDDQVEKLVLADYRDGIKKLTSDQLPVYESRIMELNSIFSAKTVSNEQIVAWLVRCAEDPATRWEGTFELLKSFERLEWQKKEKDRREIQVENSETPDEAEEKPGGNLDETDDQSIFAEILTADQKLILSNILINRKVRVEPDEEKKDPSVSGDRELTELVKYWGDQSLTAALIEQLKSNSFTPYDNAQMMETIGAITGDEEASILAQKYSEFAYMEDDVEIEEEESTPEVGKPLENELTEANAEPAAATSENIENEIVAYKPKKQTYRELRGELLSEFIVRSVKVLRKEQNKDRAEN